MKSRRKGALEGQLEPDSTGRPNGGDETRYLPLPFVGGFFSKIERFVRRRRRDASKQELKGPILAAIDDPNCDPVVHTWAYKLHRAA